MQVFAILGLLDFCKMFFKTWALLQKWHLFLKTMFCISVNTRATEPIVQLPVERQEIKINYLKSPQDHKFSLQLLVAAVENDANESKEKEIGCVSIYLSCFKRRPAPRGNFSEEDRGWTQKWETVHSHHHTCFSSEQTTSKIFCLSFLSKQLLPQPQAPSQ